MKYLSFDIECCDGKHICEFGYVLVDEQFNVLERDCITINPEHKFRLSGREKESDIKLAFPEGVYFTSPTFDFYYERIKNLLTMPDCQIVGFSLANDVKFLSTAYHGYDKEPVEFTYLDFQRLYQGYTKASNRTSVEGFVKGLEISGITLHKSDDDALAVIKALQIIGTKENLTLPETIKMLKKCNNDYRAEISKVRMANLGEKAAKGKIRAQQMFLGRFIKGIKPINKKQDDVFFGKVVCISSNYQKKHFNEFLAIVKRLYEYGATYNGKASECDILIEYQEGENEEIRKTVAKKACEETGRTILFIELEQALKSLNLTTEDLNRVDFLQGDNVSKQRIQREENKKMLAQYSKEKASSSLGDLLKNAGIELNDYNAE